MDSVADPAPPKKSLTALCAVVTGANKGIGLAVVRNLAELGVQVVLTARDEDRGLAAVRSLHSNGLTNVLFHQLDVRDPSSVTALACFLADRFSKLDILVNNAGVSGVDVDAERLKALKVDPESWLSGKATNLVNGVMEHKYEDAVVCIDTNYFGCKRVTEALLPLLRLSPIGASIVNVSSLRSELRRIPNAAIRAELAEVEKLNEERIEGLLGRFLQDLKTGQLHVNGWPMMLPAYSMSKVVVNAYTRVMARRHPDMRFNCVHPGFVKTDINWNTGIGTTDDGARAILMLALRPSGGPSGFYFQETTVADF
ncbi:hypothetical protein HPP92_001395 [Vanilla planifolia]|uniref:Uncharacterized protein n=1 Tax=Vanilla planifolia TaxID=51239 RepID=A0A835VDI1_VANPL|nr:hypothetical protein HPP92_001395 [Vanilla planifolia]